MLNSRQLHRKFSVVKAVEFISSISDGKDAGSVAAITRLKNYVLKWQPIQVGPDS